MRNLIREPLRSAILCLIILDFLTFLERFLTFYGLSLSGRTLTALGGANCWDWNALLDCLIVEEAGRENLTGIVSFGTAVLGARLGSTCPCRLGDGDEGVNEDVHQALVASAAVLHAVAVVAARSSVVTRVSLQTDIKARP